MKENKHKEILHTMHKTYVAKNKDYGDSFTRTHQDYGDISFLTRLADKFYRMENIILTDQVEVLDESVVDTALDMANYCIMYVMEKELDSNSLETKHFSIDEEGINYKTTEDDVEGILK